MFSNIGIKIMILALVFCWIGIVVSIILGAVAMDSSAIDGLVVMIVGGLFSWIGSFTLYGFGKLVQNTSVICAALGHPTEPATPQAYAAPVQQPYGYAPQNPQPVQQPYGYAPQNPQPAQQPYGYAPQDPQSVQNTTYVPGAQQPSVPVAGENPFVHNPEL